MTARLYVLDIETTDLDPKAGYIVEVGLCRVDLDRLKVYPEYSKVINHCIEPEERNAWIFNNSTLTVEDVQTAPWTGWRVCYELEDLAKHSVFTSYNKSFDFQWLYDKWRLLPRTTHDIMDMVTANFGRRLSAQAAYLAYCDDNPARLPNRTEDHRALSDATMESYILCELCRINEHYREMILNDLVEE